MLNNLVEPPKVDWAGYAVAGEYIPPPVPVDAEGNPVVFEGVAPAKFEFKATKDNYLSAIIDPIEIRGSKYQIRFTQISVKKFSRDGKEVEASMFGNYLKAISKDVRAQTNQEYMRAAESTARRPFKFKADWDAWDKETSTVVADSYSKFPVDPNNPGKRLPFITLPDGRKVFARLKIKQFVAIK